MDVMSIYLMMKENAYCIMLSNVMMIMALVSLSIMVRMSIILLLLQKKHRYIWHAQGKKIRGHQRYYLELTCYLWIS